MVGCRMLGSLSCIGLSISCGPRVWAFVLGPRLSRTLPTPPGQLSSSSSSTYREPRKPTENYRTLSLSVSAMGSLSFSADPPFCSPLQSEESLGLNQIHNSVDESTLLDLFKSQQNYLNYFFHNLDLSQTLAFTLALLNSTGTIFFTGVGKSGFVARKISQTLVSLGVQSSFLSPLDALHGDIGILTPRDVLVLFSKSGNTDELLRLVPCAKAKGAYMISVTSVEGNALAGVCDMNVNLPLERELCPFDLAPVTSTAIQMVFGDTVAIALMGARNLTKEQYAANHPAGRIGKSLIFKVKDVMKKQDELPVCKEGDLIMDMLVELTSKGCGCLLVIDEESCLIGTFTDGDLRRTLKECGEGIFKLTVGQMCNRKPRTIGADAMAVEAMKKMEAAPSPVQFLPVVDFRNILIGIVTLHGLVSAGL